MIVRADINDSGGSSWQSINRMWCSILAMNESLFQSVLYVVGVRSSGLHTCTLEKRNLIDINALTIIATTQMSFNQWLICTNYLNNWFQCRRHKTSMNGGADAFPKLHFPVYSYSNPTYWLPIKQPILQLIVNTGIKENSLNYNNYLTKVKIEHQIDQRKKRTTDYSATVTSHDLHDGDYQ